MREMKLTVATTSYRPSAMTRASSPLKKRRLQANSLFSCSGGAKKETSKTTVRGLPGTGRGF